MPRACRESARRVALAELERAAGRMSRHAALGRDWFMVHGVNLHQISNAALDALEQFVLHREDELEPAAMCAALRAIVAARNSRG